MCDCLFDNPPTFYKVRQVKGRKDYTCAECLRDIPKGEPHEYAKGLWEGSFDSFRTCNLCTGMRDEIELSCYCHGLMMDEIDQRDFPDTQSVSDFFERRDENYWRRKREREAVAN